MTTGLYLLRCFQANISVADLNELEYGMVIDILTESGNDDCKYKEVATQDDFDRF